MATFNKNEVVLEKVKQASLYDLETGILLNRLTSIEDPSLNTTAERKRLSMLRVILLQIFIELRRLLLAVATPCSPLTLLLHSLVQRRMSLLPTTRLSTIWLRP